jgi:hypothetical protein
MNIRTAKITSIEFPGKATNTRTLNNTINEFPGTATNIRTLNNIINEFPGTVTNTRTLNNTNYAVQGAAVQKTRSAYGSGCIEILKFGKRLLKGQSCEILMAFLCLYHTVQKFLLPPHHISF